MVELDARENGRIESGMPFEYRVQPAKKADSLQGLRTPSPLVDLVEMVLLLTLGRSIPVFHLDATDAENGECIAQSRQHRFGNLGAVRVTAEDLHRAKNNRERIFVSRKNLAKVRLGEWVSRTPASRDVSWDRDVLHPSFQNRSPDLLPRLGGTVDMRIEITLL